MAPEQPWPMHHWCRTRATLRSRCSVEVRCVGVGVGVCGCGCGCVRGCGRVLLLTIDTVIL